MTRTLLSNPLRLERYLRRRRDRIAFWNRPIAGWRGRVHAWAHMLFVDHGVLRLAYLNRHRIADGAWRAAQPAPPHFARMKAQGVRTIVNLRNGRGHGSWQLQREACERLGLTMTEFVVRSRAAPDPETVLRAKAFFDGLAYPAVFHCKSGADRTGFVAALYLIVREGRSADEALRQLSLRYGHFRFARTGILDAFFERYRDEGEARGIPFLDWVERHYDPEALERDFRPNAWADLLVDRILRRE
ncbi:MAG TPA: tyrosine-protein phosphatase [Microvirga sp.]|nr:tyrosine-protein phosphatase [Microvirga sp.]